MKLLILVIPFLISLLLGCVIIPNIILITYKKRLFDPVNVRKLHQSIIPRLGGVAFVPIQCCVLAISIVSIYKVPLISSAVGNLGISTWVVFPMLIMLLCGLVLLYLVGIADDLVGLKNKKKFIVQLIAASFFPLSGLWINNLYGLGSIVELSPWVGVPFTIFVTVLIINAINLIDGLDGLCSGLIGIACLIFAILFAYYGAWIHALLAIVTLGVLLPFFYFNVIGVSKRRRRIFMGDTGSMTLGYTIAFLAISFAMNNSAIKPFSSGALFVGASVLIVPVFDVARVMLVRLFKKQPVFKPDQNHLHHRLLKVGFSQRKVMLMILFLSVFYALFNLILVYHVNNNVLFVLNCLIWVFLIYGIDSVFVSNNKLFNN